MTSTTPQSNTIRDAVALACLAPSLHNSQPWRWVAEGRRLHLHADTERLMSAADPMGREIILSCGAALDHLVVAMSAAGWETSVTRFPDPYEPFHLAAIEFQENPDRTDDIWRARAEAIPRRRTDRRPFDRPEDWAPFEVLLRERLIPYHVMCDVVLDDARPRLAEASRLTEEIRANDPSYEAEMLWWTSPFIAHEGVPQSSLVSASETANVDVARSFPTAQGRRPADDHIDQSKVVVLSTHHEDARMDVLRCGEALSAVLIECTLAGLSTCTLTHMTELAPSREIIRKLTGQHGLPQVLVRVGQIPVGNTAPLEATPRRPLDDVLHGT
jgi:nitroreductase